MFLGGDPGVEDLVGVVPEAGQHQGAGDDVKREQHDVRGAWGSQPDFAVVLYTARVVHNQVLFL